MTPHLRGNVRAYVDRTLPAPLMHAYDRHLVCCGTCRSAADQERRIVAALRSDTDVPDSLRSVLLRLAAAPPAPVEPPGTGAGDVPVPPVGFRMPPGYGREPVPIVAPSSPPLHRSPMRAAVVASIAAGASVAAAWSLAVMPQPAPASTRAPAGLLPGGLTLRPASSSPGSAWGSSPSSSGSAQEAAAGSLPGASALGRVASVGLVVGTATSSWMPRLDATVHAVEEESVRIRLASSAQSRP